MIELKNITKRFYKDKSYVTALSDVSLSVPQGKIFGVIGESGAGKSTLIRCINLLEKPDSGEVVVGGQHLVSLSSRELVKARREIGMIFQHFNLLASRTVFKNISLPLELQHVSRRIIEKKVSDLLSLVGLEEKRADYPASLSGGQKQRVAIARALATDPKVLLCDEATSALDPGTTKSILTLLKDINKRLNITILLITHEMEVVKSICDHVAVISEGKMIEQGTVAEIFSHPAAPLTKKFIASSLNVDIPEQYKERLTMARGHDKNPLVKIELSGQSLDAPVMSEVSRLFHVDNHIVSARIDSADGVSFGILIIEIVGEEQHTENAIAFFRGKNIKTELLGYV